MNGKLTLAALCHCQRAIDLVCIMTSVACWLLKLC